MTDYITFEAAIEPMVWGDSTYTVLRLPPEIAAALAPAKRVEGEFGDHPVNLAITRAPVIDDPFLWTGKTLLNRTGLRPGEVFEARLRPTDPAAVDVPADVTRAIRSGGATDAWDALTPGKQRSLLYPVETAKRAETRAKRITKLVTSLL